jgi:hypothetical protein
LKSVETKRRDSLLIEDYLTGTTVTEIAREHSLSVRRVHQILKEAQVVLRERTAERPTISQQHERIGDMLSTYIFLNQLQPNEVANDLGWNFRKVRRVQQGIAELELLDLLDLSAYVGKTMEELTTNG